VRVSARAADGHVVFSVADTGLGIAPEDQDLIFREYTQVDSHLQRRVKGTGLGLPLSRRLAELLGGRIGLQSEPGVGSTFSLEIPARYDGPGEVVVVPEVTRLQDPTRFPVLVLEDNPETVFIYEKYLKGTPFQAIPASTTAEARRIIREVRPVAAIVDIMLGQESAWSLISEVKAGATTRGMPVYVVTMVDNRHKAKALGADDFAEKPVARAWLLDRLASAVASLPRDRVLVVDDDPAARYLLAGLLEETRYEPIEASDGARALELLARSRPSAVFLDLDMPGLPGEEVLRRIREDPANESLPVVVYSSRALDADARARLVGASAFVSKEASRGAALTIVREAIGRAAARDEARGLPR
jgi:CheY-like chemotaxis protein